MPSPGGTIYAIGAVGTSWIKIGCTTGPRAQMSPTALNRLERGLQSVAAERLATLAGVLAVSADYLLGLSQEVQPAPGPPLGEDTSDTQPPRQAGRPRRAAPVAS